jgi:putative FmdB family regulatory protein
MPIYVYSCSSCGFEEDILRKMSDAPLSVCPKCHQETFIKQVTSAGFQLKGTGWYATDFKGTPKAASETKSSEDSSAAKTEKKIEESKPASDTKSSS